MNTIREIPCPTCGDTKRIDPSDLRPGIVFPCHPCRCHLVLTAELTFAHATNEDLEKRPIGEQEVGRLMERIWSGGQHSAYC
jgi:hypothetical protein